MSDLLILVPLVAVVMAAGIGLGMLVARGLGQMIDHDEEPGDD